MLELGANKIEVIENLENLPEITELYLGANRIQVIQNLEPLKDKLQILAITANKI